MHRLLKRILKKTGIDPREVPGKEAWNRFLNKLDAVFVSSDEDRYLLERSLEISSQEMQELLDSSRERYRQRIAALVDVIPDSIIYIDEEGRYLEVISKGAQDDLFHKPQEEVIGKKIDEVFSGEHAELFLNTVHKAFKENRLQVITYPWESRSGRRFCEARIMPTDIRENGKRMSLAIIRDMTAERKSIEYLNVIKKIYEDATEGIWIASFDENYLEANDAFLRMLGISRDELPGIRLKDQRRFFDADTLKNITDRLKSDGYFSGEVLIRREGMSDLLTWLTLDTVFDEKGHSTYRVAMLTDISELKKSREELRFTATHDLLTHLPNRSFLFERLEEILKRSEKYRVGGALFFIDLDNFKEVNDRAGHGAGDWVLQECARRIKSVLREGDVFGRLGGDEFLLIIENIENIEAPMHVAKKIIREIEKPFRFEQEVFDLGASIGIAIFPRDSRKREVLIQYADMAMYRAKKGGKNRFMYYSRALDKDVKRHYQIERILKEALDHQNFFLLYQPQLDLESERIIGVETLLRIEKTEIGPLHPGEFIPIAEESGLILKIGRWVFEECCRQILRWKEEGLDVPMVAINLSRSLLVDERWNQFVAETIRRYGIDPSEIEFEITETTFMHSRGFGHAAIKELRDMGFSLSIDDFGTGYSSLANLKEFTVNKIKIDRIFVQDMNSNVSDRAIVESSIALAHAFGLRSIAEGVETSEQKEVLKKLGCDEMQGFLFSRPVSADRIAQLLKASIDSCT